MSFELRIDESLGAALRRCLVEQTERLAADVEGDERGEAIHKARKRCKRLRAVFRLLRPIHPDLARGGNALFREIGRGLSAFRDVDATRAAFRRLVADAGEHGGVLGQLEGILHKEDPALTPELLTERIASSARQAREAAQQYQKLDLGKNSFSLFGDGLLITYKKARAAMRSAYDDPHPETFHEWRKRVKDLTNQIQFLAPLWPEIFGGLRKELDALGDILGDDHDLSVVRSIVLTDGEAYGSEVIELFTDEVDRQLGGFRRQARALGARLFAERSENFIRRVHAYWEALEEGRK
ncbi:CHAD domain-containing protein [Terrimicrobium sacchariphilum]|uniref:CHAD domain-containing protein n=1 Tax=Terrimicrobium sacchariphilum TaxID=690879 RepID=A0A146G5B9_TERSA|nr:CHAD domain-containing protein [Terrimicrobium sacchariphilum]GAT33009.1 CHAD domain-containing protein [Terrimicrobium sacchariphilum]